MTIFRWPAIALALAIAVGGAAQSQKALPAWPQARSDLPADPAIVFGTLPNGMRYALQKNGRPEHQVALRLRIEAGSDQEAPDQRGLAHVLEHMAFRGSTHFPEKAGEYEAFIALQRLGLAVGPDANASTGWNQTTYMFDLPRSDAQSIATGLALLRDVASELTLSAAALDAERPIVLAEERARSSPGYDGQVANLRFLFRGEPTENMPIGQTEIIKKAPLARVRAFYDKYYRPERATLVVVGDIDPAALEAQIKTLFGGWKGKGQTSPEVPVQIKPRTPEFLVSTIPSTIPEIILSWKSAYDWTPDTKAVERKRFIESLALQAFRQRLTDVTQSPNPPFASASVGHNNLNQAAELTQLVVIPAKAEDWAKALDTVVAMKKQALVHGLQQSEVDRILRSTRTRLQGAVDGASTRLSSGIANQLVDPGSRLRVYTSPATDLALFDEWTKGLTLAELNAALARAFQGQGVLAHVLTPTDLSGGQPAFSARYAAAEAAPVSAMAVQVDKAWTHTEFGAPGKVVDRQEAADLGITFVRFANGVRAAIKPTKFVIDQVLVQARFSGGRYVMSSDKVDAGSLWSSGLIGGGLEDLTAIDVGRVMAGKKVGVGASIGDNGFILNGTTKPADFDLQLQLMTAYTTLPGWRPTALDQMKAQMPILLPSLRAQPGGVYALEGEALIHGGDRRWASFPTTEELAALRVEDAKTRFTPILKDAPLDISVVGDISVDAAIASLGKTFGALPDRTGPVATNARAVKFPAGGGAPVILKHNGRADQGLFVIAWPTTDHWKDPKAGTVARVLELIMEQRVMDLLRASQGKTYSPAGDIYFAYYFDGYGQIIFQLEANPADMPAINAAIVKIAGDLKSTAVTADELARAAGPRIESLRRSQATNGYWMPALIDARKDAPRLEIVRHHVADFEAVTIADVQAAANKWLVDERAWRVEVVHE